MKRFAIVLALVALAAAPALAQQMAGARGESTLKLAGGTVAVDYGRPALKGRDPMTLIQPNAEWRLGANAPTTLKTDVPLKFGATTVPAGAYVLKARMNDAKQWHLLIDGDGRRVAEVPLEFGKAADSAESLTMQLEPAGKGGKLTVHWGTLTLATSFEPAA